VAQGRGAEAQSNPVLQGVNMPVAEVDTFVGIDVSAHELSVALRRGQSHDKAAMAKFPNHPSGHKALVAYLLRGGGRVRVCLEASGNYSLDLALTLQAHRQVEISVINPRRARRFAESLGERSKTDPVDARVLCEYAARMPWVRWQPPSPVALHLRALTRAIADLGVIHTQQNNRAYAAAASQALPVLVVKEMQRHKKYLEQRMTRLRREAVRLDTAVEDELHAAGSGAVGQRLVLGVGCQGFELGAIGEHPELGIAGQYLELRALGQGLEFGAARQCFEFRAIG